MKKSTCHLSYARRISGPAPNIVARSTRRDTSLGDCYIDWGEAIRLIIQKTITSRKELLYTAVGEDEKQCERRTAILWLAIT